MSAFLNVSLHTRTPGFCNIKLKKTEKECMHEQKIVFGAMLVAVMLERR